MPPGGRARIGALRSSGRRELLLTPQFRCRTRVCTALHMFGAPLLFRDTRHTGATPGVDVHISCRCSGVGPVQSRQHRATSAHAEMKNNAARFPTHAAVRATADDPMAGAQTAADPS